MGLIKVQSLGHRFATHAREWTFAVTGALALVSLQAIDACAEDAWGGSLTVTNDYRVRGISKTQGDAAIQGGFHAQLSPGWIVGAWASSVSRDRGRSSTVELDAYTGYSWKIANDWDAKATFTHYWYPDDPTRSNYDYDEIAGSLVFRSQFAATVAWSPNTKYFTRYQGSWNTQEGASASYELTGLQPITPALAVTAGVGYNDLMSLFDTGYWYWNAGLSYSMGPLQLDVSRIDSDAAAEELFGATATEGGWSAAISWRF
jgi:uncharacterized protein (TIGR02001 family)